MIFSKYVLIISLFSQNPTRGFLFLFHFIVRYIENRLLNQNSYDFLVIAFGASQWFASHMVLEEG